jgi:hypothetical protein
MGKERIAGSHVVRRGVPVAGALLFAAALVCGSGRAVALASAATPVPAAGPAGLISTMGGRYQAMTAGDIYTIAGNGRSRFAGDGGPAAHAQFSAPADIALGGQGNLVIADAGHNRVRMVAAKTGRFYERSMTAGDVYTIAGNGSAGSGGDGGPAVKAGLHRPTGVGLDAAGNVLIAGSYGERIRVLAVKTGRFYGQAMTVGNIYTIAGTGKRGTTGDGGRATRAEVGEPAGITLDNQGNLLIATRNGGRVRVVAAKTGRFYGRAMTARDIYNIAGGGTGGLGDGGPATSGTLVQPGAVLVDAAGNVLICDTADDRIREVAEHRPAG